MDKSARAQIAQQIAQMKEFNPATPTPATKAASTAGTGMPQRGVPFRTYADGKGVGDLRSKFKKGLSGRVKCGGK
jgi:hypothetical protein